MTHPAPVSLLLERIARILQNDAHQHGLKPAQWEALRFLARANRFSRNPSALTAYLGVTKGTVSQTILTLEKKGLVEKMSSPEDRRAVWLSLTDDGKALVEADPLLAIDAHAGEMEADLRDRLEKLLQEMLRSRGGRPFGLCKDCVHFQRNTEGGTPYFCGLLAEPLNDEDSVSICFEQTA